MGFLKTIGNKFPEINTYDLAIKKALGYTILAFVLFLIIGQFGLMPPWEVKLIKIFPLATKHHLAVVLLGLLIGFYAVLGCFFHVVEDSLSSTVPVIHPTKRVFSLGLIKTRSVIEYIISFSLLFLSLNFIK